MMYPRGLHDHTSSPGLGHVDVISLHDPLPSVILNLESA
ncbi:hypothetical protein WG66_013158 [Moniliophthora roreri]|nr:hypothetical protein WG66_013158 [Moniliophthora roreri]